jgi:hypothetical protein
VPAALICAAGCIRLYALPAASQRGPLGDSDFADYIENIE